MSFISAHKLSSSLRSSIRLDVPIVVEPHVKPAPVVSSIGTDPRLFDLPNLAEDDDYGVQFNLPVSKYFAKRDTSASSQVSCRVDLHFYPTVDNSTGVVKFSLNLYQDQLGDELLDTTPLETTHSFEIDSDDYSSTLQYTHTRNLDVGDSNDKWNLILPRTNLRRNSHWTFILRRLGSDVGDTYSGDIVLLGIELAFFEGDPA